MLGRASGLGNVTWRHTRPDFDDDNEPIPAALKYTFIVLLGILALVMGIMTWQYYFGTKPNRGDLAYSEQGADIMVEAVYDGIPEAFQATILPESPASQHHDSYAKLHSTFKGVTKWRVEEVSKPVEVHYNEHPTADPHWKSVRVTRKATVAVYIWTDRVRDKLALTVEVRAAGSYQQLTALGIKNAKEEAAQKLHLWREANQAKPWYTKRSKEPYYPVQERKEPKGFGTFIYHDSLTDWKVYAIAYK